MKITLSDTDVVFCIIALEYRAHNEAGQSQDPNLFLAEDTLDWELAQKLRKRINFIGQISPGTGCLLRWEL